MSKVFLAEPYSKFDLSKAEVYGELEYLVHNRLDPFDPQDMVYRLSKGLESFNPQEDFLCLTGNVITVAFMLSVAAKKFNKLQLLIFHAPSSNYRERIFVCQI